MNDPHSYTDISQGKMVHADLKLDIDFSKKCIDGAAKLKFENPISSSIDLDTRDLEIQNIMDDHGSKLTWTLGKRDAVIGSRLRIAPVKPTQTLTISYATTKNSTALQWLDPKQTAGKKHPYLFSQCQPHHARSMVPIQDSPIIRFSYHAELTIPEPLSAVMSAAPGALKPGTTKGTRVFTFEMPQRIPAYLLALAVGNITSEDLGSRSRVWAEPEKIKAAAWEFEPIQKMLDTAEKLFGPYPWERYDFLVLPPAFPFGGMENPRMTFLTPSLLAGDRSLVDVLAHELAHSWTGNLVTNATMNDFWLNEGFTMWAERRILEMLEGKEAVALSAAIGMQELKDDIDLFKKKPQFTALKNNLDGIDPDEVYSRVPYEKGFFFITLLEQTIGRNAWDRFVREYMARFQFTSITTERFLEFLEEKLPGLAKKVDAKKWVYEPGIPANCPKFHSKRLETLKALAAGWSKGERPNPEEALKWPIAEWMVYLGGLPKKLSTSDCKWLDENLKLSQSRNAEIQNLWFLITASSAYEPAYPGMKEFLATTGRMKYLKPIYRALHENKKTGALAKQFFSDLADNYHPIAKLGLQNILSG